ncbi:hypothetical protein [Chryseobacterium gregarium]|uniref:hypothetical protein n=1 Tax=Chryseobacterium gregarium TaxID=456299 RepID=UPI00041C7B7E|nr:hypothetical protein [Chryseobacterium gregarium]
MNYLTTGKIKSIKALLISLPLCTILCSCPDMSEAETLDYSIVNQSGQTVELSVYVNDHRDPSSKVILLPGEKLQKVVRDDPPYKGYSMWALFDIQKTGVKTDMEFVYNNHKKTVYHHCPDLLCGNELRNIFGFTYNNENTEVYIITSEDYLNAVECDGNCY